MTMPYTMLNILNAGVNAAAQMVADYSQIAHGGWSYSFNVTGGTQVSTKSAGLFYQADYDFQAGAALRSTEIAIDKAALRSEGAMAGIDQGFSFGDCWFESSLAAVLGNGKTSG